MRRGSSLAYPNGPFSLHLVDDLDMVIGFIDLGLLAARDGRVATDGRSSRQNLTCRRLRKTPGDVLGGWVYARLAGADVHFPRLLLAAATRAEHGDRSCPTVVEGS